MSDSAWYPIISFPAVFGRSLGLGFRPPSLGNRAPERLGSAQMQENVVNGGLVGGLRIPGREVKFADPRETTNCESRDLARLHQSGTKAGGSNTIRYRSSPGPKRYRPGFGEKLSLLGISRVSSVRALVQALGVGSGGNPRPCVRRTPRYSCPGWTVREVLSLVGRVQQLPILGQLQDPWRSH